MEAITTIQEDLIDTAIIDGWGHPQQSVSVLRLDKIHPVISGNKWYKLKYYLSAARNQNKKRIVTFGGAYSNHILATAAACKQFGFASTGVIRGEAPKIYSHTLREAAKYGMEFHFLSRNAYSQKQVALTLQQDTDYLIPEGGYGLLGASGAATIPLPQAGYDCICCAVGTGTMMAGLINGNKPGSNILGISTLKNHISLEQEVMQLLGDKQIPVNIHHEYHFGGYAKYNSRLIKFMNELYLQTAIPTDFVYTAKLFYGVRSLLQSGILQAFKKILIIHSGGLQGNSSLPKGTLIF